MDIPSVYWIIGLLVLGALLFWVLAGPFSKLSVMFRERAPLVKKYWQFVMPLIVLTITAYVLLFAFYNNAVAFDIVGQISGLTLGIIAGYIAFAELGESRFEKLQDSGMDEFRAMRLKSARLKLEEAHRIKPKDVTLLSNLMELYLIEGLYEKFDSKITLYQRIAVEEAEELALLYLIVLKEAIQDRPRDTRASIKDVIQYVANHPHARETLGWSDKELMQSQAYQSIGNESRTLAKNTLNYITAALESEDDAKFAEGDYLLKSKGSSK